MLITKAPGGFAALATGAHIGTSSVRRARQLQWLRPDLAIEEWRGNVQTRLRKLAERADIAGIVLAQAGLERLGYDLSAGTLAFEAHRFHVDSLAAHLLPAIGQGAIALQSRTDRDDVGAILRALNHEPTFLCVRAERELQRLLSGDCALPVGVRAELDGPRLRLRGILFGAEGTAPAQGVAEGSSDSPEQIAADLFRQLLPGGIAATASTQSPASRG